MTTDPTASPGPLELFNGVLRQAASTPFVTYYNELSGERAELSAKSLGNWVAKTHFLLVDALGLGAGDRAQVRVAADWLAPAILLGAWSAGVSVSSGAGAEGAAVAVTDAATLDQAQSADERFAINPGSLSRSWAADPPTGAEDFVGAVRPQPDAWGSVRSAVGERALIEDLGVGEVMTTARAWLERHEVRPGERLLFPVAPPATDPSTTASSDGGYPCAQDWIPLLLVPLLTGGSVVYVATAEHAEVDRTNRRDHHDRPDAELLARRAEQERARQITWPWT